MIPDEKKEEIRETADLVEVISDYVKLKRSGSGYVGLCPFHDEKTPSFHVTPNLNIYKCFGCGESGDVFNFVMQMEGVGFVESMRSLADRYNISLPEQDDEEYDEDHHLREGIYHALRYAGVFFYRNLIENEEADKARDYLQGRGYDRSIVKKYGLGYAPRHGEAFYKSAIDTGLDEEYLLEAGLIKHSNRGDGYYDAFRGRLMFPIFNPSGKVIAFAGRILGNEKAAKYINSPQTKVYNKSETVYGINFAKHDIRKNEEAVVVEGYTDVISLHQAGVGQAVATSGTSLTPQQMKSIKRYGDTVTLVYDADAAGFKAMQRGVDIALAEGLDVKMLELPEGEDPDSFVKQFGKESFLELKDENAEDFVSFLVHKSKAMGKWDDPIVRKKITSQILQSIANIKDPVGREMFVQHLNSFVKLGDRALMEELGQIISKKNRQESKNRYYKQRREENKAEAESERNQAEHKERRTDSKDNRRSRSGSDAIKQNHKFDYEKELIRLMLIYKDDMIDYIGKLCNKKMFLNNDLSDFFADIIERYTKGKPISVEHYTNREHPYPQLVGEICLDRHTVSDRTEEKQGIKFQKDKNPYNTAKGALKAMKIHYLERLQQTYNRKYQQASDEDKKKELNALISKIGKKRANIQRTPQQQLFPDPDLPEGDTNASVNTFQYTMKPRTGE